MILKLITHKPSGLGLLNEIRLISVPDQLILYLRQWCKMVSHTMKNNRHWGRPPTLKMSLETKKTGVGSKNWRDKRSSICQFLLWWRWKGKCSICASGEILSLCFIFKAGSSPLLHILPSIDTTLFTFLSFHCASLHCYILPGPLLCLSLSFKITPLSSIPSQICDPLIHLKKKKNPIFK